MGHHKGNWEDKLVKPLSQPNPPICEKRRFSPTGRSEEEPKSFRNIRNVLTLFPSLA